MQFLRKLMLAPILFLIVSLSMFLLVDLAPGDAAREVAGQDATAEQLAYVREELGLNDPVLVRYGEWLGNAVTGDLGYSVIRRGTPVSELIAIKAGPTMSLALLTLLVTVVLGLFLGVIAAIRKNRWPDHFVSVFTSAGIALPQFWVGLVLVSLFALDRAWLPATGYTPLSEGVGEWMRHLILPTIALAWLPTAEMARHMRSACSEVLERPYIVTARSKGLSTRKIVTRHVLRNAGIPVVTVLGIRIASLLGGTAVIETAFGIQGLGKLTVDSVLQRDMSTVLGVVALATGVVLVVNLIVDASYSFLDPRAAQK